SRHLLFLSCPASGRASTSLFKAWMAGTSPAMTMWLRHLFQPELRIVILRRKTRQRTHQFRHRVEIMNRPQFVDMRQHDLDAPRARLKALEAQQRIEPDQAAARAVQPVDLEGQRVVAVAL